MNQNYLKEFQRWTAGPQKRREALSAEFAEHMREAEAAGELGSTLERLGPPRDAQRRSRRATTCARRRWRGASPRP